MSDSGGSHKTGVDSIRGPKGSDNALTLPPAAENKRKPSKGANRKDETSWIAETKTNLNSARALRLEADMQLQRNFIVDCRLVEGPLQEVSAAVTAGGGSSAHAHAVSAARLKRSVGQGKKQIQELSRRIDNATNELKHLSKTAIDLQKATRRVTFLLSATEKRLALRAKRPASEVVQDHFQIALDVEKKVLLEASTNLETQTESGKEVMAGLESLKERLLGAKELVGIKLRENRVELAHLEMPKVKGGMEAPPSPNGQQNHHGHPHGHQAQKMDFPASAYRDLIEEAQKIEADGMRQMQASQVVLHKAERQANKATNRTFANMRRQVDELGKMRLKLESELRETRTSLAETVKCRDESVRSLERLEEDWNEMKHAPGEDLETAQAPLKERRDWAESMVKKLSAIVEQLTNDLKLKTAAWKVDSACLRMTAGKAAADELAGHLTIFEHDQSDGSATSDLNSPDKRRRLHVLDNETLEAVRSKIKAAAYTGHGGRRLETIFARFDKDGSGELEDDEVRTAFRRTLRMPHSAVTDAEIASLCGMLDADGSGTVAIRELVDFIGADKPSPRKSMKEEAELLPGKSVPPRPSTRHRVPRRKVAHPDAEVQDRIRARIKAAAITGSAEMLFGRFDKDGSGLIEDDELRQVFRRILRIPKVAVSDEELTGLCTILDTKNSGTVKIEEIVSWIGPLSESSKRPGRPSTSPKKKGLAPEVLERVRARMKGAAYTGHGGRQLDVMFSRFDKDGTGQLEVDEVRRAMRRTLRISPADINDNEIRDLCQVLDSDCTGTVSIDELVKFIEAEAEQLSVDFKAQESQESFMMMESKPKPSWSLHRKRHPPLAQDQLEIVRAKIKAAAYCGPNGKSLGTIFGRFDADGSGQLEDEEVRRALRRTLRIPQSVLTDAEISSLCATLDVDKSGTVGISEMVVFAGAEPVARLVPDERPATDSRPRQKRTPREGKTPSHEEGDDEMNLAELRKFPAFSIVRFSDLQANSELNDQLAVVIPEILSSTGQHSGRLKLVMESGVEVSAKPSNLKMIGLAKNAKLSPQLHVPPSISALLEKLVQDQEASLNRVRSNLKAVIQANSMYQTDSVTAVFGRDGKGGVRTVLTPNEVKDALRHDLRIPSYVISDLEVSAMCCKLNPEGAEGIAVSNISQFILEEPRRPKFVHIPMDAARAASVRGRMRNQALLEVSGRDGPEILHARFDMHLSGELSYSEVRRVLRRTLRIAKSVVSDVEVHAICASLDTSGSGLVRVEDLVNFATQDLPASRQSSVRKLQVAHSASAASADFETYEEGELKRPKTGRSQASKRKSSGEVVLTEEVLRKVRAKIKSAAYSGTSGYQHDAMFQRLDLDRTGYLGADELRVAVRRTLRIPEKDISDEEILALCELLDSDSSGFLSVKEIVEFIAAEPKPKKRSSSVSRDGARPATTDGTDGQKYSARTPRRGSGLDPDLLERIRSKIKAAAYGGPGGKRLDVLLSRFDTNASGYLEVEEVRKAIRQTLKIPESSITNTDVKAWCATLDADGSGSISIDEIVKFVGAEPASKRTSSTFASEDQKARPATAPVPKPSPRLSTRRQKPLELEVLDKIRSKIKSASYTGSGGKQLDTILTRFDSDHSGELEPDEVRRAVRRTLRITEESISDAEILSWCAMLDANHSGTVSIQEIVDFVGFEPEVSKRTGKSLLRSSFGDSTSSLDGMRPTTAASQGSRSSRMKQASQPVELDEDTLQKIRSKLKAASYTSPGGKNLREVFDRLDVNHSGSLETEEVRKAMRKTLHIPDTLISETEVTTFCEMLDADKSGNVSIDELVAFVDGEKLSRKTGNAT